MTASKTRGAAMVSADKRLTKGATHSYLSVHAKLGRTEAERAIAFLRAAAVLVDADYGHLAYGPGKWFFVAAHQLERSGLRRLRWMTLLGPSYVALFGEERIETSPAFAVEQLGAELWSLQLTADIRDPVDDPDAFEAAQEGVVEHLGRDAFSDWDGPTARRLPDFSQLRLEEDRTGIRVEAEAQAPPTRSERLPPPPEGAAETGAADIDREQLHAFLEECVAARVGGFGESQVAAVEQLAAELAVGEERDLHFQVQANGSQTTLQVRLSMDEPDAPTVSFYSDPDVIAPIEAGIRRFLDFDFFDEKQG
jgi:hypothetical protein